MRPIVGITMNTRAELSTYYVESVEAAGGCPLILSRVESCDSIKPVLDQLDGIIFSGGTDINPHYYNDDPRYGLQQVKPGRDQYEFELLRTCLNNYSFPILGICRGLQLLNIYQGGNMYQCLEKEKPEGIMHALWEKFPMHYPSHAVQVEKDSRLFALIQEEKVLVNSLHHQGIKELGQNLISTARSSDGLIEALELVGDRFVVAVQWHPEIMSTRCEIAASIFKGFIQECRVQSTSMVSP